MGNIDALDLVDMVFILKDLGDKFIGVNVFFKSRLGRFFVELEGNNYIGTKRTRKIAGERNRIAAVRTACGRGRVVTDDFAAAGVADVNRH